MRDINNMSVGNALALNRRNSVPAQLGLPDICRAIKGLVVCNSSDINAFEPAKLYQPYPKDMNRTLYNTMR